MNGILEKLWDDYFCEECAPINTEEERELTKKTAALHKKATKLLTKKQERAVEEYMDALIDLEAFFVKKAFFKGCEVTASFLLETCVFGKRRCEEKRGSKKRAEIPLFFAMFYLQKTIILRS